MIGRISSGLKAVASKILDLEEGGSEQFKLISEMSRNKFFDLEVQELRELIELLKEKHAVLSIVVTYPNGSMLISSNGSDLKEAVTGSALFSYIRSEIPKSQTVLIKGDKDWFMVYAKNRKVFIVRAASSLANAELNAISEDIESFLRKNNE